MSFYNAKVYGIENKTNTPFEKKCVVSDKEYPKSESYIKIYHSDDIYYLKTSYLPSDDVTINNWNIW